MVTDSQLRLNSIFSLVPSTVSNLAAAVTTQRQYPALAFKNRRLQVRRTWIRLKPRLIARSAQHRLIPLIRGMLLWLIMRVSSRGGRSCPSAGSIRRRTLLLTSRCRRAGMAFKTVKSSVCCGDRLLRQNKEDCSPRAELKRIQEETSS